MSITNALQIAQAHGASIGRRRPGLYYVTWVSGGAVQASELAVPHVRDVVRWIETNLAGRAA